YRGHKYEVHALPLKQRQVAIQVARVTRKIFVWTELSWIYEDGSRHGVAFRLRSPDERQMPFVQGTHCWDKADEPRSGTGQTRRIPGFRNRMNDFHVL